jgi:hypothetical protein
MKIDFVELDGDPGVLAYDDAGVARAGFIYQDGDFVPIHAIELFYKGKELTPERFTELVQEIDAERDQKPYVERQDDYDPSELRKGSGQGGGQWTSGGGGGGSPPEGSGGSPAPVGGKGSSPAGKLGHGYSERAKLGADGVITTDNVEDAVRALFEKKKVQLNQPRQVSTLLERLGDIAARMIKLGEKAPNFNLCSVSVQGTNLFCAESKGIPRIQMPQVPKAKMEGFRDWLSQKALVTDETEKASYLRATQDELNGASVALLARAIQGGKQFDRAIFVSQDNYILDGHHRWAAEVGLDAANNVLGDRDMKVQRVDMPIVDLLAAAEEYTGGEGKKGMEGARVELPSHSPHDEKEIERKVDALIDSLGRMDYDPSEPRRPAGEAGGGEWTAGGGAGAGPLTGSKGHQDLISTANPTGKGVGEAGRVIAAAKARAYQRIDIAAMKQDMPKFRVNVGLFKNSHELSYPYLRHSETEGSAEDVAEHVKKRMTDNLVFLATKVKDGAFGSKDDFKNWAGWYEGAHHLAEGYAKKYGTGLASASGVIAALSPQNDWSTNVYQADTVMDAMTNKLHQKWTQSMTDKLSIWTNPKLQVHIPEIQGKTLQQIIDAGGPAMSTKAAMWIRTENEAHSSRTYRNVLPSGELGDVVLTKGAHPRETPARWKTVSAIANAVEAYMSKGDLSQLSEAMGGRHKVRSFYNNILDPDSPNGDVTVDTHAIGAAFLYPSTGTDAVVAQGLASTLLKSEQPPGWKGPASSKVTGVSGTYGIYADAYRDAAKQLGIQPRQLQSIVWEAKQRLFSATQTGDTIKRNIRAVWVRYRDGEIDAKQAQNEVWRVAKETMG